MKADRFRNLLIDACLLASAVDGDVDDAELAVIREVMTGAFIGEDVVQERVEQLEETAETFCDQINQKRNSLLEELNREHLTKGQLRRLIDLSCRVVAADGVFKPAEIGLLHTLITACEVSVSEAALLCPDHASLLHLSASEAGLGFTKTKSEDLSDISDFGETTIG